VAEQVQLAHAVDQRQYGLDVDRQCGDIEYRLQVQPGMGEERMERVQGSLLLLRRMIRYGWLGAQPAPGDYA